MEKPERGLALGDFSGREIQQCGKWWRTAR